MLAGIKLTLFWGGPVGMLRNWMPSVFFDRESKIATARGYTGRGVSTTSLAGGVLAELIAGKQSKLGKLPIAERQSLNWEREPLCWLAVRYAQKALLRIDAPLAEFLIKH